MPTEYYHPHNRGGSEWSTFYLSQDLIRKGHKIIVLTPNYGAKKYETKDSINIYRFNIIKKLVDSKDEPTNPQVVASPFWHTNLFWSFQTLIHIYRVCKNENVDVIHVQGKYFLPAAVIVGKLLDLPVVFTARDYQVICNLGFCLWQKTKSCSLKDYFFSDFSYYKRHYMNKPSAVRFILQLIFLVRARLVTKILWWFATQSDIIVCTSKAQAKIYRANGLEKTKIIYNTTSFLSPPSRSQIKNQLVYAGRLTPGKGVDLLIPSLHRVPNKIRPNLLIAGEGYLKQKLREQISLYKLSDKVMLLGRVPHNKLINIYKNSVASITPSLWPENFGRGPLESISQGTPAITSTKGGLPEIVQEKYGLSVEPTISKLASAIIFVKKNQKKFRNNIKRNWSRLSQQFSANPTREFESLYFSLLKSKHR